MSKYVTKHRKQVILDDLRLAFDVQDLPDMPTIRLGWHANTFWKRANNFRRLMHAELELAYSAGIAEGINRSLKVVKKGVKNGSDKSTST